MLLSNFLKGFPVLEIFLTIMYVFVNPKSCILFTVLFYTFTSNFKEISFIFLNPSEIRNCLLQHFLLFFASGISVPESIILSLSDSSIFERILDSLVE